MGFNFKALLYDYLTFFFFPKMKMGTQMELRNNVLISAQERKVTVGEIRIVRP